MRTYTKWLIISLLNALISLCAGMAYSEQKFQVISHPDTATDALSESELRLIFSMHKNYWPDGTLISLVAYENDDPLHIDFVRQVLRMQPHQLDRNWNRLIYTGRAAKPIKADTVEAMLEKVRSTKGAIGYIPTSDTSDYVQSIRID